MNVRSDCPHPNCGKQYKVSKDQLGRKFVCKQCGREFILSTSDRETIGPSASSDAQETPNAIPNRLGRFKIRSRLGAGGFGTVYRAYDPVLQREVALKVPRAAVLENKKAQARFLREPKAAAQLRHPHIVPVYDAGGDGKHYYIASAYIEGQTFEAVIRQQRPGFRESGRIVQALAEALGYAHRMGIVHRDVKPANVMIDSRSQPMLMDFGLAQVGESEERLTQDGSVLGTPAYMAPEQANRSFGEMGPASDQYALGVILYELLTGQTPFSGPPSVVLFNLVQTEPDRPQSLDPAIPRDLETICLRAMSKRPEERYADCDTMAEDLRRWLADEPIVARRMSPIERMRRWCGRNPMMAGLAAVAFLLVVGIGVAASIGYRQTAVATEREYRERDRAESARREAQQALEETATKRVEADEAQAEAEGLLADAEAQRQQAERDREHATAEQKRAEEERFRAEAERERRAEMEQDWEASEPERYADRFALAYEVWGRGDSEACLEILETCPAKWRHWEWGLLKKVCQGYTGHELDAPPRGLLLSPDGKLVSGCIQATPQGADRRRASSQIKVWDARTCEELFSIAIDEACSFPSFSPDSRRIVTAYSERRPDNKGERSTIRIWDARTGRELLTTHHGNAGQHPGARFSPDGESIVLAGLYTRRTFLDSATGEELHQQLGSFLSSPDGKTYVTSGRQSVTVCDLGTGRKLFAHPGLPTASRWSVESLAYSGSCLAIAIQFATKPDQLNRDLENVVQLWDAATWRDPVVLSGTFEDVPSLRFSPDGSFLLTIHDIVYDGASSHMQTLWKVPIGEKAFALGKPRISSVAFTPDGKRVFSGADKFSPLESFVWDTATGRLLAKPRDSRFGRDSIQINSDSTRLLVGNVLWGSITEGYSGFSSTEDSLSPSSDAP